MATIWYENIEDILLNITDPNTWGTVWEVPWVSSPKINAGVSVYNVEATGGTWIAWWSTNVSWSASDYNTVAWSSGSIYLPDGTSLAVSSWNTGNMSSTTYIYYDRDTSSVSTTTSASASVGENKILLCVASPTSSWKKAEFQAFGTDDQSTFIHADNIAANTITANEIASNTITASEIASWAITASKIDVNQLSAISANLGTITAWDISWTTVTAGTTSGWAVKLYPYSSTRWRIDFYYNWNVVWYIRWSSAPSLGGVLFLEWDYIFASGRMYCWEKLRIPVWNNLYW
jgi:hypothetical protein